MTDEINHSRFSEFYSRFGTNYNYSEYENNFVIQSGDFLLTPVRFCLYSDVRKNLIKTALTIVFLFIPSIILGTLTKALGCLLSKKIAYPAGVEDELQKQLYLISKKNAYPIWANNDLLKQLYIKCFREAHIELSKQNKRLLYSIGIRLQQPSSGHRLVRSQMDDLESTIRINLRQNHRAEAQANQLTYNTLNKAAQKFFKQMVNQLIYLVN